MTFGDLSPDGRARVLADGYQMPLLGLGVWQVPDGATCVNAVRWGTDRAYERNVWRGGLRRIRAIMPIRRTS
jgi:hypothetical protein